MLNEFLVSHAYAGLLVFIRVGCAFIVMPGFSAVYVQPQVRLMIAAGLTLILYPSVLPMIPPAPTTVWKLVLLIISEGFYGLYMGLLAQFALGALHFAGSVIGQYTGLTNAMVFDAVTDQQGALLVGLFSTIAVVLMFALNLHHLVFMALYESYSVFQPGSPPDGGAHLQMAADLMSRSAFLALKLASPFVLFAVVFQTGMGLLARLSPQLNIFFVALPLQILFGLALIWISLPAMMMWFLGFYESVFQVFLPD